MSLRPLNSYPDNLEDRFKAPEGWETGDFKNDQTSHKLHYGYVLSKNAKGTVVVLSGLSEFSEKYYETTNDLLKRNLNVFTMDWHGQGRSDRAIPNTQKRHSEGFEKDIENLDGFIKNIVLQNSEAPLILIAHSMGANIGMRYAIQNPDTFQAIAFSAPMFGIKALKHIPDWLASLKLWLLAPYHKSYVFGGHDWDERKQSSAQNDIFSSDTVRKKIHNQWSLHDTELQIGSPTFGWIKAALRSCKILKDYDFTSFKTPLLIALARQERLVDNDKTSAIFSRMPNASVIKLDNSKHEILMETDEIRNQFWDAFDKMLAENKILS
ncbi:MAG: alpha/beta hydrolase [Pseudomonadota bacterium]